MNKSLRLCGVLMIAAVQTACGSTSPSQTLVAPITVVEESFGRILIIGMDGTRAEALAIANTPNLDAISSLGSRDINAITGDVSLSGPGWASMLTGVWCDKHNVIDNDASWSQSSFDSYPHFITRLETAAPSRHTFSVSHWDPINDEILCADERDDNCGGADQVINVGTDEAVRDEVVEVLTNGNPDVVFMQFDDVDHAGHGDPPTDPGGFCPFAGGDSADGDHDGACTALNFNQDYLDVVETTDGYIGDIFAALTNRSNYAAENWIIIVSPDHGGGGQVINQHGFPHDQDRRTFLIVAGNAASAFPAGQQMKMVDIAATALFHLGVTIDPSWNLDGQPVGITGVPAYQSNVIPSCFNQTSGLGDVR
jgi:predicted AlkP superfamily pyrophosphatase or phosphodiesterase